MQVTELVDDDGTVWRHDPEKDTFTPGESVPMVRIVFESVYPELVEAFKPVPTPRRDRPDQETP